MSCYFDDGAEKFPLSLCQFVDVGTAVDVHDMNGRCENLGRVLGLHGIDILCFYLRAFDMVVTVHFLRRTMVGFEEMGLDVSLYGLGRR